MRLYACWLLLSIWFDVSLPLLRWIYVLLQSLCLFHLLCRHICELHFWGYCLHIMPCEYGLLRRSHQLLLFLLRSWCVEYVQRILWLWCAEEKYQLHERCASVR